MRDRLDRWSGRRRLRHRDEQADLAALPDPSLRPGTDRVPQIRHIVVLMMENHSFDNYLGALGRGDGFGDPLPSNPASDGRLVPAHRMSSTKQVTGIPSQSWRASHQQFGDGRNEGFVTSIEDIAPGSDASLGMGYWTEDDLPFYAELARTFPIADRWFCSCLGPTFPNRRFLMAATANGLIDDAKASVIDYPKTGTIFDLLNRHGVSWANYHHVPNGQMLRSRFAHRLRRRLTLGVGEALPWLDHRARGAVQCTANLYPLGITRTIAHLRPIKRFFDDVAAGTLPGVSIIDPDFTSCSEENPQDIRIGEGFAAAVINAVMHGPGWPHTLLIWLYDEHGGYFDHVPPPAAVEPDDVRPHSLLDTRGPVRWLLKHTPTWRHLKTEDTAPGRYDRYGFRVPAAIISPYSKKDFVSSTVFDHTSVLKLIEEKWNLPPLTRRDAAAIAPWEMVDLSGEPAFLTPPALPRPARPWYP